MKKSVHPRRLAVDTKMGGWCPLIKRAAAKTAAADAKWPRRVGKEQAGGGGGAISRTESSTVGGVGGAKRINRTNGAAGWGGEVMWRWLLLCV